MRARRMAILAVCALGVALVAGACGAGASSSGGSSGATAGTSPGSTAFTPHDTSATLVIGSEVFPPSLDLTSNASAAIDEVLDYNVYQHLVQLDPKGQVVDVLATHDSVSADGKTYTFTVRTGVKFSNGDPLTAADAAFSLKRAANPKDNYPYGVLLSDVSSVTAAGNKVIVTLKHADNQFLYNLAAYSNGVVLDPKAVSKIATDPVGTGPYVFSSQVNNYSVTLRRNPDYWGTPAGMSQVEFRYFSNANTEDEALKSGAIQVIDNLANPSDVSQFKGVSGYKLLTGPTNGKIQMTINNSAGPLAKLKVRQAILYATDKQAVLQEAGAGYGRVIASDDVPGDPWYLPSVNATYPYNPTKAKALLAQAGYPHGLPGTLTLTLPPYQYAQTAAPLIQAELKAVGINVKIKTIQFPIWIDQVFTHADFQLTIIDHVEARDISNYANCSYYWKYAGCNTVNAMLTKADEATSTAGEVAGYEAVVRKINADAVNDWLFNNDQLTVAKSDVVGLPTSGLTESFDLSYVSMGGSVPASAVAEGYSN